MATWIGVRCATVRRVAIAALLATAACGDGAIAVVGALTIDPPALVVPAGDDATVSAHLADDGTPLALPVAVTWTVRDPGLAAVTSAGDGGAVLHGLAPGSTVVTATLGDMTAASALTITPPRLIALTVAPPVAAVVSGDCVRFMAEARFGDGTTVTLDGGDVGWGVSAQGFSEDGVGGFCPFGVRGEFTVFAGYRQQLARATLTVTPAPLADLTLFAPETAVVDGDRFANALATYADGAGEDVTLTAAWSSSDTAVLEVDAGRLHGVAVGTATVAVTYGGLTRTAAIAVRAPTLTNLGVEPFDPTVPVGGHQALTVRGFYDNGTSADVTSAASFTSFDPGVFTVDAAGVITGISPGVAFVRAELAALSQLTAVTVTP